MHNPVAVANKILEVAQQSDDKHVTPMQLIKLAYMCHGFMLGAHGRPLLNESVQAWRYGPVVRSIYNAVSKHRDQPVPYPIKNIFGGVQSEDFDKEEERVIRQVYEHYGKWDGIKLSHITHREGTPWYIVWNKKGKNAPISNDLIENHYKSLLEKWDREQPNEARAVKDMTPEEFAALQESAQGKPHG